MKDKRQRIAIAWPYAAVYSDPAFAASILQAAANSVGMPYGYPPGGGMLPQSALMGHQLPANRLGYGFPTSVRYNPYPIPIPPQGYGQAHALRSESQASSLGSPLANGGGGGGYSSGHGVPHQSPGLSSDHPLLKSPREAHNSSSPTSRHDIRSPTASSQSTSSLSPDSDRVKCDFGGGAAGEGSPVKCNGDVKHTGGILQPPQDDKTATLVAGGDKPNLFRPYKSEA